MPTPSLFGKRLKEGRDLRGWTQAELAERAGVPAMMISHYETGTRESPSLITLKNLADALELAIEWLLGRTDDPTPVSGPLAVLLRSVALESGERLELIKGMLESVNSRDPKTGKKHE